MSATPKIWLTTLGCAKNQVDSDKVTGVLHDAGYRDADTPETADVVMVNTCAFIEPAREESINTLLELASAKRDDAKLVVLGCMAQRYEQELIDALPEADAVIGLDRYAEIVGSLDRPHRVAANSRSARCGEPRWTSSTRRDGRHLRLPMPM